MRYSKWFFCTLFLIFFFSQSICASDTLYINEIKDEYLIEKQILLFIDSTKEYSLERILNEDIEYTKNSNLNFGWTDKDYWLKINIKNVLKEKIDLFIVIPYPVIDEIDFFEVNNGIITKEIYTGELKQFDSREVSNQNFVFNVNVDSGNNKTYYIRINNNGDTLFIPVELKSKESFFIRNNIQTFIDALFYGLFIFIFIFNFFLFVRLKDRVYLFYPLYIISIIFAIATTDGYTTMFLWSKNTWISNYLLALTMGIDCVFLIVFSLIFLDLKKQVPVFYRFYRIVIGALLIALLFVFIRPAFIYSLIAISYLAMFTYFPLPFISLYLVMKKFKPSYYYFIGTFTWCVGMTFFTLRDFGYISDSLLAANGVKIGLATEGIALSLAVIEYFRIQKEEANKLLAEQNIRIKSQKKSLQTVNEALKKLSIVASRTDNSVAIFDKDGIIEWCNERFRVLHGFDKGTLIEDMKLSIESIFKHPKMSDNLSLCIDQHKTVIFENTITKKGKSINTQTTLTPLLEDNKLEKLISIDSDITTIKVYEKKLIKSRKKAEESDKLKTAFLANMSHEIRTPMNAILGFSYLLKSPKLKTEKKEQYISVIDSNTKDLLKLMDDILDIAKIESGQTTLENEEFSLTDLMKDINATFLNDRKRIEKDHIGLTLIDTEHINENIYSDSSKIKQVLSNLLSNAFKYTQEGSIEFGYKINGKNIVFYVNDTGIGVEEDKYKKIFKRFHKEEQKDTEILHRGTGLGLAIAKHLVGLLKGKIWLESTVGKGSTFYFSIPLTKGSKKVSDTKPLLPGIEKIDWKDKVILVAEDNKSNYNLIVELLSLTKVKIHRAKDGEEVVILNEEIKPNLILMDIQMPKQNGYMATKEIRKSSKVPIIALTAYAHSSEREISLKNGCDDYLSKPVGYHDLISILKKFFNN